MADKTILNSDEIPISLHETSPATKLLYLYLKPLGYVDYSSRDLANLLGVSQPTILNSLDELKEQDLICFLSHSRQRVKATYRVKVLEANHS